MRKKNIKLRVKNLVEKYNTKSPYKLCEKLNIEIIITELNDIKGFYTKILNNKYIIINEKFDDISQKIILSHELGHAVLHSTRKINFMKENLFFYTNQMEKEANAFAGYLLSMNKEYYTKEEFDSIKLDRKYLDIIKFLIN